MARMHSGRKGKSGSNLPFRTSVPDWVELRGKEAEDKVLELFKKGYTMAQIGILLRDVYGVPKIKIVTNKKIRKIIKEHDLLPPIPEDLLALMRKAVNLNRHLKNNPKDYSNRRGLMLIESKIKRLSDYYKRKKVIPADWKYSIETAEVLTR